MKNKLFPQLVIIYLRYLIGFVIGYKKKKTLSDKLI